MMKTRLVLTAIFLHCAGLDMLGQVDLKKLDHADFLIWNTIQNTQISADGSMVSYRLMPGEGDPELCIYSTADRVTRKIARVSKSQFDYEQNVMYGLITPYRDTLRNLERKKVDKKKWPGDTLFITSYLGELLKVANVTGYKSPEKAGDWLAYTVKAESMKGGKAEGDTTATDSTKKETKSGKGKSKKELEHLIIRQLSSGRQDTIRYIKEYVWAEKVPVLMFRTESDDSTAISGVGYWSAFDKRFVKKQKGEYSKLAPSVNGGQLAFLGNLDTTKMQVPPWQLFYYDFKSDSATSIAGKNNSALPLISQHADLRWSEDGKYLFYGRSEMPLVRDTTLLPDETVKVEVWTTDDPMLFTMQNATKEKEEKRSYDHVYDTESQQHLQICSPAWESASYSSKRNERFVLVYTDKPYQKEATWLGDIRKDIAKVDLLTGAVIPIKKGLITSPRLSPGGQFAYGYSEVDSTWWSYQMSSGAFTMMNRKGLPAFANELHDAPSYPNSYGHAGWVKDDQSLIVYDRYDMWAWTPQQNAVPQQITSGREHGLVYRYIRTDRENDYLSPIEPWLIHAKDDLTKSTGYTWFYPSNFQLDTVALEPFDYSRQVTRARAGQQYLFERENFSVFPNIRMTDDNFRTSVRISDANPQQADYRWGTIELYEWMDWDGVKRTGMLVKPVGFDTLRSYPTIVNFYERSSDGLHNHPTLTPHRSTINYAFYASRGYVIFNPDISYKVGAPGESAYQIVMSGVESLAKKRIADPNNLALQGHSWGGYQVAYIVTRTNQFKCAEAGAVVANMTSAYGGIRWESGRARMFQYEQEQSRLGKTLWQDPQLYIANSPLFKVDKITTPLLLLHNDDDGAVPFEQGIEFYLALRRNGKKAWLLNYPGEPHWPVKWENRKDFQKRMSQFFDHYLLDAPMPEWMKKGTPAVNVGKLPDVR